MHIVLIAHSLLRWAVVVFGIWTVANALTGITSKRSFTKNDNRSNLLFMISCDIQLLIGIVLYIQNGWFDRLKDLGNNMKDPITRFFTLEHLSLMLIAWLLVHIGRATVKSANTDAAKHKKMLMFFGMAFLLIMVSIPWPFRAALGKGWLPAF
jgi:hypothetical protein